MASDRLLVTYRLKLVAGEAAARKLEDIAWEQTVEVPRDVPTDAVRESVVGRIESLEERDDGRWVGSVSYDPNLVRGDVGGLVNLLFGNLSFGVGVRVEAIEWPDSVVDWLPGPSHGVTGMREMAGKPEAPLLCGAIKPLGLDAPALASICGQLAEGGADFIKDDHSLADQAEAPFEERVRRCLDAVAEANAKSGGRCRYFPNLPSTPGLLDARLEFLREVGVEGVMVMPLVCGLPAVHHLATTTDLVILGHPSFTGWVLGADHGIAPGLLFGDVLRLVGCDAVIFANPGGRFCWSEEDCDDIAARLRRPIGAAPAAFPMPAGGVEVETAGHWIDHYGPDTILLIGGSLLRRPDLVGATRSLAQVLAQR